MMPLLLIGIAVLLNSSTLRAQDYVEDDSLYYEDYYEDEYDDSYDDDSYFGEEEDYYGTEDDAGYEDEYYDDEYYDDEEYYDEGDEYSDEEYYDDEEFGEYEDEGFEDEYLEEEADDLDLADDRAGEVELEEIEQPVIKEPRVLRGYTAKLTVASPYVVGLGLNAWWYSFIDARVALEIPQRAKVGALDLGYTVEISSYGFANQHPEGGEFSGIAILAMIRAPLGPLMITAGGGLYGFKQITSGMVFGASYRLPLFQYIDLTMDTRLNYAQQATPAGAAYWVDIGGSFGYKF